MREAAAWLAVKSNAHVRIAESLGFWNARACSWTDGIAASVASDSSGGIFLSAPIDGWTIVTGGQLLLLLPGHPPMFVPVIAELASAIDSEVQFFAYRTAESMYAYARALPIGLVRASCFVRGEVSYTFTLADRSEAPTSADAICERAREWSVEPPFEGRPHDLSGGWIADPMVITTPPPTGLLEPAARGDRGARWAIELLIVLYSLFPMGATPRHDSRTEVFLVAATMLAFEIAVAVANFFDRRLVGERRQSFRSQMTRAIVLAAAVGIAADALIANDGFLLVASLLVGFAAFVAAQYLPDALFTGR